MISRALAILLLSYSAHAAETDVRSVIYWYAAYAPPIAITYGPDQGKGWADRRIEILRKRLPQFRHQLVEASDSRMLEDIKTRPNVCSANLTRTPERAVYIEFSKPLTRILPNGLITTRLHQAQLTRFVNERGEMRLAELLAAGKHRLGIAQNEGYGAGVDQLLRKYARADALVIVPSSDHFASRLLKLGNQDEFEAILGSEIELHYIARQRQLAESDFVFVPLAEEPALVPTYIGCSKSPLGRRFITAINLALADETVLREDSAAYRLWLHAAAAARLARLDNRESKAAR
jgi:uncharacterized protein (TIGR02285 family)